MRTRKAQSEARRLRILEAVRKNPHLTARLLAERFRVSTATIRSICKKAGIKLEQRDLLEEKDARKLVNLPRDPEWGYHGITREAL